MCRGGDSKGLGAKNTFESLKNCQADILVATAMMVLGADIGENVMTM